ncbi:MAG: efflux RND transporter permease subunit [Kiritimatiellae bacterium]|nr:efflux RND transporter permease subunit [Kiritimatiellia bacterium]
MNLARAAVHRPIFTTMVTLIVIILGGVSLYKIPVDLMPDVTYPTLSVSTTYENASPEEVEELITRPVEEAMSAVPGVEKVTSVSAEGMSNVRITFSWGTDLDAAANDVRDRLDRVIPRLPEEADRPVLRKFDLASFPILMLGASSRLDPVQMRNIIDNEVKYRIERVPGVASLDVWGGQEREIHVLLDRDKIKALNIPLDVLVARLKAGNVTLPAGNLESGNYELVVRVPGEYRNLEELADTAVAVRDGVPVLLRQVAAVEDSWAKVTRIVRVNGVPGIRLAVNKQSGKNTVEVAKAVLREIERINKDIPQITITPIMDTADYIRRSITNVGRSAVYGGLYAVAVLLFFLRDLRSTLIISAAIPISIVATFMLVYFGGFTLNLMTLGGLALGVGMLVDNSIVVLENIYRIRETDRAQGADAATVAGAGEVTSAIVASTLTTVVVFLPLVFVRGMAGVMFKQLAYVVSFALLSSLLVALTLVPMLAAKFLRPVESEVSGGPPDRHRLFRAAARLTGGLETGYRMLLRPALNHRGRVVAVTLVIVGVSIFLVRFVGTELMPATDESEVRVDGEMEVGTRLALVDDAFRRIEEIVAREVPERKNMMTSVGGTGWRGGGSHTGEMRIALKPQSQRKRSSAEVADALRRELRSIPGTTVRTRAGQGLFVMRLVTGSTDLVQVEIRGDDLATGDMLARRVKQIVESVRGVTDARISRDLGKPERLVVVDRRKAETMKVSVSQVAALLETALGGSRAGYYREGGKEYAILVRLKDAEMLPLEEVLDLTVTNADGDPIILRNIVKIEPQSGPVNIERTDQERVVRVEANVRGRDLGSIIADIRAGLASLPVPRNFSITFGGDYEEQQKAFGELGLGLILALVLVYMVMACLYESLRSPLVVMFSVPLAVIGVVLMLLLTDTTFNIQSYIGCIMLGGIVVNNAIVLVDHINLLRRRDGMAVREAIEEAARRRLRPILMTSLTTILGLIPLAVGIGEGGEAQAPLARAVIGGLTSSTFLTLVFIPVVYSLFEEGWRRRPKQGT